MRRKATSRRKTEVEHCCETMRCNVEHTCDMHPIRYECPDCLIEYWPTSRTYGLIVYGQPVVSVISYCPWCGTKLPDRLEWL